MKSLLFLLMTIIWFVHCEVVNSAPPVETEKIIYITASWCGPCVVFQNQEVPKLVAKGFKINKTPFSTIRKIDIDKDRAILSNYKIKDIKSVPTFIYLRKNTEVDRISKSVSAEEIEKFYWRNKNGANK